MRPAKEKIAREDLVRYVPAGLDPRCVLALVAGSDDQQKFHPSGSGVLISDRLAISAWHVLDDYQQEFGLRRERVRRVGCGIEAASGFAAHERWKCNGYSWERERTTGDPSDTNASDANDLESRPLSDMAILSMGAESPLRGLRFPRLRLVPPEVGEVVVAMGFPSASIVRRDDGFLEWHDEASVTKGKVMEVNHQQRDSTRAWFPSFAVDFFAPGGMSGGPVFDAGGRVVGVVSSSLEFSDGDSYTTCSSVWPALAYRLEAFPGFPDAPERFLYDEIVAGLVKADGLERFAVTRRPGQFTASLRGRVR
jgi:S1-C subfamily serine protease